MLDLGDSRIPVNGRVQEPRALAGFLSTLIDGVGGGRRLEVDGAEWMDN